MSLPKQYTSAFSYFDDVTQFLQTYQWIYNYPNTDILLNRVFEQFPVEWIEFFENTNTLQLNNLSLGIVTGDAPESLKAAIDRINTFKPHFVRKTCSPISLPPKNLKIREKKYHEIQLLSSTIHDVCNQVHSKQIIDVGSGLGYMPEYLYENYDYKVLGLEGNIEKYKLALQRQNANSSAHVKYYHHFVTQSSVMEIMKLSSENPSVLTGLHACADLSVTVKQLFLKLDFIKGLVIMPCCYHRLELLSENGNEDRFKNFPISDALKEIYCKRNGERFLRRYFLRLACQQSVASFCKMNEVEHRKHAEQCLFRAILEEVAKEENCHVSRNKRKTGRPPPLKDSDSAFEYYVNNLKTTHTLIPTSKSHQIDNPSFHEKMFSKWQLYKNHCCLVEALTALQMAIQSVCENLVLLDRVEFLKEKGVGCTVHKVTDDHISPRCYALVATKL